MWVDQEQRAGGLYNGAEGISIIARYTQQRRPKCLAHTLTLEHCIRVLGPYYLKLEWGYIFVALQALRQPLHSLPLLPFFSFSVIPSIVFFAVYLSLSPCLDEAQTQGH